MFYINKNYFNDLIMRSIRMLENGRIPTNEHFADTIIKSYREGLSGFENFHFKEGQGRRIEAMHYYVRTYNALAAGKIEDTADFYFDYKNLKQRFKHLPKRVNKELVLNMHAELLAATDKEQHSIKRILQCLQ